MVESLERVSSHEVLTKTTPNQLASKQISGERCCAIARDQMRSRRKGFPLD